MKILILGAGQVGSSAAYHLSREEANEVTVVDMRADILRELQDRLDIRTVVGHAAYPDILDRAGANDADIVVALTDTEALTGTGRMMGLRAGLRGREPDNCCTKDAFSKSGKTSMARCMISARAVSVGSRSIPSPW